MGEQARSNSDASPAELALALIRLAECYCDLAGPSRAVSTVQEAVFILRQEAVSARNGSLVSSLADALFFLGGCYRRLGQADDGVTVLREAAIIQRQVATDDESGPIATAFQLGEAFFELGMCQRALGHSKAAEDSFTEASQAYRVLTRRRASARRRLPVATAVASRRGGALLKLGACYRELGQ